MNFIISLLAVVDVFVNINKCSLLRDSKCSESVSHQYFTQNKPQKTYFHLKIGPAPHGHSGGECL